MQTDLDILRALEERAPAPVPACELAEISGVPLERLPTRMKSLVSLRYVDCVSGDGADLYALAPSDTWPSGASEESRGPITPVHSLAGIEPRVGARPRGAGAPIGPAERAGRWRRRADRRSRTPEAAGEPVG
jgi:hypothetical protein